MPVFLDDPDAVDNLEHYQSTAQHYTASELSAAGSKHIQLPFNIQTDSLTAVVIAKYLAFNMRPLWPSHNVPLAVDDHEYHLHKIQHHTESGLTAPAAFRHVQLGSQYTGSQPTTHTLWQMEDRQTNIQIDKCLVTSGPSALSNIKNQHKTH